MEMRDKELRSGTSVLLETIRDAWVGDNAADTMALARTRLPCPRKDAKKSVFARPNASNQLRVSRRYCSSPRYCSSLQRRITVRDGGIGRCPPSPPPKNGREHRDRGNRGTARNDRAD